MLTPQQRVVSWPELSVGRGMLLHSINT
jgi:hypothetical protein